MEACVGNEQEDKTRTRRRRRRASTIIIAMFLWGFLIFTQFGLSNSSALSPDQYYYHQTYPSPRKAGPFYKTSSFQSPITSVSLTDPRREGEEDRDVYKDDKRLVHTGPNPLHN